MHPSFFILQLPDFSTFSKLKEKNLGCTMCIRAFSSFSSLSSEHPDFCVLQVTASALKNEKARIHIVHPNCFSLKLTPHTTHLTPHTTHLTSPTSHQWSVQWSNGRSNGPWSIQWSNGHSNNPMVGPMLDLMVQWSVQWSNGRSNGPMVGPMVQ